MKDREFINPFTDFGFKRIFGQEISKEILIDFLNLLLNGEQRIVSLRFKNPELQPDIKDKRRVVFDLYCESDKGTQFIVEMQAARQEFFYDRGLYYQSRALAEQGNKGKDWQYDLKPVYGIFFMDFIMHENSKFRTDVALMDMETGKVFNNRLRQIFLEMPRFTKEANECENDYERWLYLIKNMHMLKRMPFNAQRAVWDAETNAIQCATCRLGQTLGHRRRGRTERNGIQGISRSSEELQGLPRRHQFRKEGRDVGR